jgi:hypothetical protein
MRRTTARCRSAGSGTRTKIDVPAPGVESISARPDQRRALLH